MFIKTTSISLICFNCYSRFLVAAACSPMSMRRPLYGQKNCTSRTDVPGFTCVLSCDAGFAFLDQPESSSLTYQCTDGSGWNVPVMPKCVQASKWSVWSFRSFCIVSNCSYILHVAVVEIFRA